VGFLLLPGCASTQKVSLECVPSEVNVFVDGRQLEGSPEEISLGTEEAHTVYLKGGDHQPQMVVMEPREVDGKQVLTNADLCRQVTFTEMRPELVVEIVDDAAPTEPEVAEPPASSPVADPSDPAPVADPSDLAPAAPSVGPAAGS